MVFFSACLARFSSVQENEKSEDGALFCLAFAAWRYTLVPQHADWKDDGATDLHGQPRQVDPGDDEQPKEGEPTVRRDTQGRRGRVSRAQDRAGGVQRLLLRHVHSRCKCFNTPPATDACAVSLA